MTDTRDAVTHATIFHQEERLLMLLLVHILNSLFPHIFTIHSWFPLTGNATLRPAGLGFLSTHVLCSLVVAHSRGPRQEMFFDRKHILLE